MIGKNDSARLAMIILAILCLVLFADPVLASDAMVGGTGLPFEILPYEMRRFINSPKFFIGWMIVIILWGSAWALGFKWAWRLGIIVLVFLVVWVFDHYQGDRLLPF